MKDKALDLFNQNLARWKALEQSQQRRLAMAVSAVLVVLGLTVFFLVRPTWVPVANNLDFGQSHQIAQSLTERGVPNNITNNGRMVVVRERDFSQAVTYMHVYSDAFAGVSPTQLEDVLENMGMATSEDTRNELFRRAQEGEVETMLMTMEGISGANVTLNMSDSRSRFLGIDQSTATVVLTTTQTFDRGQSLQIASAVAAGVEGLTLDGVVITDQFARNIFNGPLAGDDRFADAGAGPDPRMEAMMDIDRRVRGLLGVQFSDVRVSPNIVVETEEYTSVAQTFTPAGPNNTTLMSSEQTLAENASGTGAITGPEAGAVPNAILPPGYGAGGGGQTESSRVAEERTFVHNNTVTNIHRPSGTLLLGESNISVIANVEFMIFEEMFNEGFRPEDSIYVEGMSWEMFVQSNRNNMSVITSEVDWDAMIANATGIPVDNIQFMAFNDFIFVDSPVVPFDWYLFAISLVLAALVAMLGYGMLRRTKEEEVIEVEPELSVEDLLVSTRIEEQQLEEAESLAEIAYSIDSEVKMQIDKFVDEKPEAVAQLLRSWMNEGWE